MTEMQLVDTRVDRQTDSPALDKLVDKGLQLLLKLPF